MQNRDCSLPYRENGDFEKPHPSQYLLMELDVYLFRRDRKLGS
jgi:hypothetical protein